jgi:hypothetical protein
MRDATRSIRTVRVTIPSHLHAELRHLGIDLDLDLDELVAEGIRLLLRYHDRAEGLPEPRAPLARDES